jgi:hypothetical protein
VQTSRAVCLPLGHEPLLNSCSSPSYRFDSFFKSIKRLPHPNTSKSAKSSHSSSYLRTHDDVLPSISGLSLSRFNFPNSPSELSSHQVNDDQFLSAKTVITQTSYAETPKVLRYSGASFDLLNPHDSLRLSDILTAAELESAMSDYVAPAAQHEESSTVPQPRRFANLQEAFAAVKNRKGMPRQITIIFIILKLSRYTDPEP